MNDIITQLAADLAAGRKNFGDALTAAYRAALEDAAKIVGSVESSGRPRRLTALAIREFRPTPHASEGDKK